MEKAHAQKGRRRTSTGRADEDHSQLIAGGGRAGGMSFEALDARIEAGDDILQLLELILDETHVCDLVLGSGKETGRETEARRGDGGDGGGGEGGRRGGRE